MKHSPLHNLPAGKVSTGGRVQGDHLSDAHISILVCWGQSKPPTGALVRVIGELREGKLIAEGVEVIHVPTAERSSPDIGDALELRAASLEQIRSYFDSMEFWEVETPNWVAEPGTDVYLDPFVASLRLGDRVHKGFLHTSPEFAMKELLAHGAGRIFQVCKVYRNGEVTPLHNPEFTIIEWYRPWELLDDIIADVEAIVRLCVPSMEGRDVVRITMAEAFLKSCGIAILDGLELKSLRELCRESGKLKVRDDASWDDLFFELMIEYVDPYIATLGAVIVTEWPAPLAVLAQKSTSDPRVAHRFEMYVDGVELANGFQELTDSLEQRARFEQDNQTRQKLGKEPLPIPERLLSALEFGLPPSAGVALGFDRVLMLAAGSDNLDSVMLGKWETT